MMNIYFCPINGNTTLPIIKKYNQGIGNGEI
jgi:hypothetical protein